MDDTLEIMLQKLYGLPPFDDCTNFLIGDSFYAKSIYEKFGSEEVALMKQRLGVT